MDKYSLSFKDKMISSVQSVENTKFVQLSLEPGQGMTKHKTPLHLNLLVLTGRIRFTMNDEELVLEAGEMVHVDPALEHEVRAVDKSTALLMLVPKQQVVSEVVEDAEPPLDHENAFMHPEFIEKVAPELRPLIEDHIEVCKVLEESKGPVVKEKVEAVLRVVGAELDHHFIAEEELLFPSMAKHVGGMDVGPVARLIEEHHKIRKMHGEATEIFDAYLKLQNDHVESLLHEKIKDLRRALLNHLGKEDSHLFPMASRLMTDEEKKAIAEGLPKYA